MNQIDSYIKAYSYIIKEKTEVCYNASQIELINSSKLVFNNRMEPK